MTQAIKLKPTLPTDFIIVPGVLNTPVPTIWDILRKKPEITPTFERRRAVSGGKSGRGRKIWYLVPQRTDGLEGSTTVVDDVDLGGGVVIVGLELCVVVGHGEWEGGGARGTMGETNCIYRENGEQLVALDGVLLTSRFIR